MGRQTSELLKLSGSTDGKQIKVTGTNSAGAVTVHTAHATALDLVWLYAFNSDSVTRTLTIEWGGTSTPDNIMTFSLTNGERVEILAGDLITGALVVKAFASAANVVTVSGQVERVTNNG